MYKKYLDFEFFKYEKALSRQRSFLPIKETCGVDTSLIVPMAGNCSTIGNTLLTLRRLAKLSRVQTNTQDLSIKWNTKEASNQSPIICFFEKHISETLSRLSQSNAIVIGLLLEEATAATSQLDSRMRTALSKSQAFRSQVHFFINE